MSVRGKVVPLFGAGVQAPWGSVSKQLMRNMYPRRAGDKGQVTFVSTPGYASMSASPAGAGKPCRGYIAFQDRCYAAFGTLVYTWNGVSWVAWTGTAGASLGGTGPVHFAMCGTQLAFCANGELFYSTDFLNFAKVGSPPGNVLYVTSIADRFVATTTESSPKFWWSALLDCTSWPALNYATMEGEPSYKLMYAHAYKGTLYLFGVNSTEFWAATGDTYTFARMGGTGVPIGIDFASPPPVVLDSGLYILGNEMAGAPSPFRVNGYNFEPLATPDFHRLMVSQANMLQGTRKFFAYKADSEEFFVMNFNNADLFSAYQYNIASGSWSVIGEASTAYPIGMACWVPAAKSASYTLLFDTTSAATVYKMDPASYVYSYNGTATTRQLVTRHVSADMNPMRIWTLELDMETGVGTTGGDADPQITLEVSKDGGHTFVSCGAKSYGASAAYSTRVYWNRLGCARDFVFRLTSTNGVPLVINNAQLRVE